MIVSILCDQIDQQGASTETTNLTYAVVVNLLRQTQLRQNVGLQDQIKDGLCAKLVEVLTTYTKTKGGSGAHAKMIPEFRTQLLNALKALSNGLQDSKIMEEFVNLKGYLVLNQVIELDDLAIKEACLAVYIRMATDTETNLVIVLESELLVDIFALTAKAQENVPVLRNLLILMAIMLREKTEQVIEQLSEFDVVSMLVSVLLESGQLAYLALSALALLIEIPAFSQAVLGNKELFQGLLGLAKKCRQSKPFLEKFMEMLLFYLLCFDRITDHYELDSILSLIRYLRDGYLESDNAHLKQSIVLVLKRLASMQSKHISDVILQIEQLTDKVQEAPQAFREDKGQKLLDSMIQHESETNLLYSLETPAFCQKPIVFLDTDEDGAEINRLQDEQHYADSKTIEALNSSVKRLQHQLAEVSLQKQRLEAGQAVDTREIAIQTLGQRVEIQSIKKPPPSEQSQRAQQPPQPEPPQLASEAPGPEEQEAEEPQ